MPSVTPRLTLLGAILAAALAPVAFAAPSLIVNQDTIGVQSPTSGPGVSYRSTGANSAELTAFTDGYLLCANVGSPMASSAVELVPRHESGNQHQWSFPAVKDVFPLAYRDGVFSINREADGVRLSTLTCNPLSAQGEWTSPLVGGIFADSFDVAGGQAAINYHHMINWDPPPPGGRPGPAFDWTDPDWAAVPQDPCVLGANDQGSMRVDEADACAAATGVAAPDVVGIPSRGATMWVDTWQLGYTLKLTYLFRIDATLGAQTVNGGTVELPMTMSEAADAQSNSVSFSVRDAFDKTFLSGAGSWCILAQLPAVLDEHTCDGAGGAYVGTLSEADPFITKDFPLAILPPANSARASFYMAVTRDIIGGQNVPADNTPIAEVSIFVEPAAVAADGNQFRGDDVVFGFVPESPGFRWMKGGPDNP